MTAMSIRTAVILAAGAGARMWPFAQVRNKAAMPVAGVPNVRRLADTLAGIGVDRLVVVIGAQPGSVRHAMLGCPVPVAFVTAEAGGTAAALLAGLRQVEDDRFLVVYGDTVTPEANLRAVAEAPAAAAAAGAILTDTMPPGEGSDWYHAHIEDGVVRGIVGHECDGRVRVCGVMALHRSIIPVLEANPGFMRAVPVGGMPPAEADLMQSLNDWDADVAAVPATDFVIDMDKPWLALAANHAMARHLTEGLTESVIHPTAVISDGAEISGFVQVGAGSVIGNRSVLRGAAIIGSGTRLINGPILEGGNVIGDGTRLSDYGLVGRYSVVGNDCVVGHGAEIDGAMFDGSYLWHYCEVCGLVGRSVDIGAATVCGTLRFDDGNAEHRIRGRRERPAVLANSTYYGDFSRTGVNVVTMPGARIGCYACVGAGVVVTGDVPDRTLRLLKQETIDRPWGPERYGW